MILTFLGYSDGTSTVFHPGERIELVSVDPEGTLNCRALERSTGGESRFDCVWPDETNVAVHPMGMGVPASVTKAAGLYPVSKESMIRRILEET